MIPSFVTLTERGKFIAVNLDNVTSITFDRDSAIVYFNMYDPNRKGPDAIELGAETAKYLYRVVTGQAELRPPYARNYPGSEGR